MIHLFSNDYVVTCLFLSLPFISWANPFPLSVSSAHLFYADTNIQSRTSDTGTLNQSIPYLSYDHERNGSHAFKAEAKIL